MMDEQDVDKNDIVPAMNLIIILYKNNVIIYKRYVYD